MPVNLTLGGQLDVLDGLPGPTDPMGSEA